MAAAQPEKARACTLLSKPSMVAAVSDPKVSDNLSCNSPSAASSPKNQPAMAVAMSSKGPSEKTA